MWELIPGSIARGWGREGRKAWRAESERVTMGAQPCWGPSEESNRMCLSLSLSGKLGIYLLTPILPGWECSWVVHPLAAHIRAALSSSLVQAPRTLENPWLERQREAGPEGEAVIALGTTQHKCVWAQSWSRGHGAGYPELRHSHHLSPGGDHLSLPIPQLSVMSLLSIPCGC